MAGGTFLIDSNGTMILTAAGKADVCDSCCGAGTPIEANIPRVFYTVDGYPAVVYAGDGNGTCFIIRATNVGGTAWSASAEVYVNGTFDGLLQRYQVWGFGTYQYAYTGTTHTARMGASAADPDRLFLGLYRNDGNSFLSMLADNDQATTFTGTSLSGTGVTAAALLLPTDRPALFTSDAKCWVGDDVDGSSFTSYDCYVTAVYAANVAGRPAICTEEGVYLRADDNTGTAWTNSPTSSLSTGVYDMKEVNSLPALLIRDTSSPNALAFVIGDDADATGWGTPVQIPTSGVENGEGVPSGAIMEVDGTRVYVNWGIFDLVPIYEETPTCTTYSYCYYAIASYKVVVWESYSDDYGATWSTPTEKYSIPVDTDSDQFTTSFDRNNGKLVFTYYGDGGTNGPPPQLYYEGVVVAI